MLLEEKLISKRNLKNILYRMFTSSHQNASNNRNKIQLRNATNMYKISNTNERKQQI
jgi:hypothetical protein